MPGLALPIRSLFQSTPGFKAGRYLGRRVYSSVCLGFNPLPALRPGDTIKASGRPSNSSWFQSTPGFKAGRYASTSARRCGTPCFNPLPALRPGDTRLRENRVAPISSFNPLPALRPGDTVRDGRGLVEQVVSIHSRL